MVDKPPGPTRTYDDIFRALPPLDSDDYLDLLRSAPTEALPPEVLARAYRQLPVSSPAHTATFTRLFSRTGRRWEYLGPLARHARRRASGNSEVTHDDLLQGALARILEVLPTPRGEFAESSWNAFCRHEFSEAWRKRYGRRGQRLANIPEGEPEMADALAGDHDIPPWHVDLRASSCAAAIEEIARRVVEEIPDTFVRAVARETWFEESRPSVSGTPSAGKGPSLMSRFPGKSRFQIARALKKADAQLAAALLAESDITWTDELRRLLQRVRGSL